MERVGGAIARLQQRHDILRSLAQKMSLPRRAVKHQMRIAPLQPMERHTTIDSPDGFAIDEDEDLRTAIADVLTLLDGLGVIQARV